MKTLYTNLDDILKDLVTKYDGISFKFRGHDYDISKITNNLVVDKKQITFWDIPCYMAIKSEREICYCGAIEPEFSFLYPDNKIYKSWMELLTEYKIEDIPLKDVLCSEEVDITDYWDEVV
ncbi:MAG: hypothetical protein LBC44_05060 [Mycoplasmataceae bacterium]|nr:hypothetical protein [Mycoplasmataceae bacterium]